jgi:predicted peroxiredoxin
MPKNLVVKITHAADDPERAQIGCTVAATALASGVEVALFLAHEGVRLALPGVPEEIHVPEGAPLHELIDSLYTEATVTVCTPCAARRALTEQDFRAGTELAGAARFVELAIADEATALVY